MKIAIFKTSLKENERRLPVYPEHFPYISSETSLKLVYEKGFGSEFGIDDSEIIKNGSAVASRNELFQCCDVLILPKPLISDFEQMREKQILWGWAHCVQQPDIVQIAIKKKLTIITWESMYLWGKMGDKLMHSFYKNNELAGYAAVIHMLALKGIDGLYGPRRKVIVMGYGSVSKGAVLALRGRGFNNIHVYTQRPIHNVSDQNPDVYYKQFFVENDRIFVRGFDGIINSYIDEVSDADIIINGILQDTDNPIVFIDDHDVDRLKSNAMIIDISCDKGMGFSFAEPTTFQNPIIRIKKNIDYYSVDHTPSYLWNAASREISRVVLPYLDVIAGGETEWFKNKVITNAIEILNGKILNPKILSFQGRQVEYPHNLI